MCGRYFWGNSKEIKDLSETLYEMIIRLYGEREHTEISPGCDAPVFACIDGSLKSAVMRWGFTTGNGSLVINAKSETLGQCSMFSGISRTQRCVIPATGYYEWRRGDGQKFAFTRPDDKPVMYIAGLYRREEDGLRFTVITRAPTKAAAEIHDRMPVIIKDRKTALEWLSGSGANECYSEETELSINAVGDEQLRMRI